MQNNSLQAFIEEVTDGSHLRVQDDLGDGFVRLKAAEAQRRQAKQDIRCFEDVVIEMLRNSRDAHASAIFVATWKEGSKRCLTMIDNGDGIPQNLHETVFEPFVTSKLDAIQNDRWGIHGRGMALYSIRENTNIAKVVISKPSLGSSFYVESDSAVLSEKKDQSSLPTISKSEEGGLVLRGPHNIIRTAIEFSIDERNNVSVYFGSPIEIAATLYYLGQKATQSLYEIFNDSVEDVPYIQRLAKAYDDQSFTDIAESLGLPLSSRSAHRIINEEIEPLKPLLSLLGQLYSEGNQIRHKKSFTKQKKKITIKKSFKLEQSDKEKLNVLVSNWYKSIAEAYYLEEGVDTKIIVTKDEIKVTIPIIHSS